MKSSPFPGRTYHVTWQFEHHKNTAPCSPNYLGLNYVGWSNHEATVWDPAGITDMMVVFFNTKRRTFILKVFRA